MIRTEYIVAGGIFLAILLMPKRGTSSPFVPSFCPIDPANDAGTTHFQLSEFHSKDGVLVPVPVRGNIKKLMQELEIIRSFFGDRPIKINSGYRSPSHNLSQGGEEDSLHQCGMAVDIIIPGVHPDHVADGILDLINGGFIINGGVGRYNGHTHYDIGPSRRWDKRN